MKHVQRGMGRGRQRKTERDGEEEVWALGPLQRSVGTDPERREWTGSRTFLRIHDAPQSSCVIEVGGWGVGGFKASEPLH